MSGWDPLTQEFRQQEVTGTSLESQPFRPLEYVASSAGEPSIPFKDA